MTDGESTEKPAEAGVSQAEFNNLKQQMQNWQAKATDLEKRYENVNPDEYFALKDANKNLESEVFNLKSSQAGGDAEQISALLEQKLAAEKAKLDEAYQAKFEELTGNNQELSGEIKQLRVFDVAMSEAAKIFTDTSLPLIKMLVEKELDLKDGEIVVKGKDGEAARSNANPGEPMSLTEYLEIKATEYPDCAKSDSIPGAKMPGQKVNGKSEATVEQYLKMSPEQRAQLSVEERGKLASEALKNTRL